MKVIFKNNTYKSYQDLLDREYKDKPITILTKGESNAKLKKGITEKADVMLLHMLPHNKADVLMNRKVKRTLCPFAKLAECHVACLNTAGRGGIVKRGETTNAIEVARLRRSLYYLDDRENFLAQLHKEITAFMNKCKRNNKKPCIRLNGTSDIQYEYELYQGKNMFEHFPEIQFYDYTKIPTRKVAHIPNYHLTWSYSESNESYANLSEKVLDNIAVVFRTKDLPSRFKGRKVIDGDKTDMRFLDEPNVIVGLKAKGQAKKDYTGFVIDVLQIA